MSPIGIGKSKGTLVLVFLDKHGHTTHRCTNPVQDREGRLHRTRAPWGWKRSTHSPGGGARGEDSSRTHSVNKLSAEIQRTSETRREDSKALKRALGMPRRGGQDPGTLPTQPRAEKGSQPPAPAQEMGLAGPPGSSQKVAGTRFPEIRPCWPPSGLPSSPPGGADTTPGTGGRSKRGPRATQGLLLPYPLLPPGGKSLPHRGPTPREGSGHPPGPTSLVHATFCRARGLSPSTYPGPQTGHCQPAGEHLPP